MYDMLVLILDSKLMHNLASRFNDSCH